MKRIFPFAFLIAALVASCSSDREEHKLTYEFNQVINFDPTLPVQNYIMVIPFDSLTDSLHVIFGNNEINLEEVRGMFVEEATFMVLNTDTLDTLAMSRFREAEATFVGKTSKPVKFAYRYKMPGGSGETGTPSQYPGAVVDSIALDLNYIDLKRPLLGDSAQIKLDARAVNPIAGAGKSPAPVIVRWRFVFGIYTQK